MLAALLILSHLSIRTEILLADFEGTTYGTWTTTGTAFGSGPARGTLPNQMEVRGYKGHGLANIFNGGDDATGTLTSPIFKIERRNISFLIGGGGWAGKTCMNLLIDGRVLRTATGPNVSPGGSEKLRPASWDVHDLEGQQAQIQIVDDATGGWGHINVDNIVETDEEPKPMIVTRTIQAEKRFLNLPVSEQSEVSHIVVKEGNQTVRDVEVKLATGKPDYWVFLDLTPFKGKTLTLSLDDASEEPKLLDSLQQSNSIKSSIPIYHESLRPQFHFSAQRGWLNDPNGLVYYDGAYHMYYQHNPFGHESRAMHWGHAVSTDLVHWKEQPEALYPPTYGDDAWSGSAVVDKNNTGGFKTGKEDVIVAAYYSTARGECIGYSNDRGRTFTQYSGNPVVKNVGRDPRLFWYEPNHEWVMAVYDERPVEFDGHERGIAFYTSPDLRTWNYRSRVGDFYECPDMFKLPVPGKPGEFKWVVTAADSDYMIGDFDGHEFKPDTKKLKGMQGETLYASQTFSDTPDGRRIQIGWSRIDMPGMPFNQMMAFPCQLLLKDYYGLRLAWKPIEEISRLYKSSTSLKNVLLQPGVPLVSKAKGDQFDIEIHFSFGGWSSNHLDGSIIFTVKGMPVSFDGYMLACGGKRVALRSQGDVRLRILADQNSLELFTDDGTIYMPMIGHFQKGSPALEILSERNSRKLLSLDIHELKSIWH